MSGGLGTVRGQSWHPQVSSQDFPPLHMLCCCCLPVQAQSRADGRTHEHTHTNTAPAPSCEAWRCDGLECCVRTPRRTRPALFLRALCCGFLVAGRSLTVTIRWCPADRARARVSEGARARNGSPPTCRRRIRQRVERPPPAPAKCTSRASSSSSSSSSSRRRGCPLRLLGTRPRSRPTRSLQLGSRPSCR